jgi:alanyl-tRNA synthetase
MDKRRRTMRHHSATHLMHKALREVLGPHVQQKGSLVDEDKTRFDFSHNAPMTSEQLRKVEDLVNAEVLANEATNARVMAIDDAQKLGAMMLFGEKYGDEVRVLDIGSSRELCGGTHVARTGDIGLFKITGEGGVAAGVRRIEAVAGTVALQLVRQLEAEVALVDGFFQARGENLQKKIQAERDERKALERQVAQLKLKLASGSGGGDLASTAVDVKGVKVLAAKLEGADAKTLRDTMDQLKGKLKTSAIVLAASEGEKVSLIAGVTQDLIAA